MNDQIRAAECGAGPISIREAARRVGRNVKAVHGDVTALINAGLLDRSDGGGVVFPFDAQLPARVGAGMVD